MKPALSCAAPATILGEGAQMMIGVDLEKDEHMLHDAYNDAAGVTAHFNLNVLVRINRELGGNFDSPRSSIARSTIANVIASKCT